MDFLFIDNETSTDRRSQRLIRSHGMKGKNTGKVIPARGHRGRREDDPYEKTKSTLTRSTNVARGRPLLPKNPMQAAPPADPFCGSEFSYFSTPVPVTASSRQLFHDLHGAVAEELYPRAFCGRTNEIGTRWFETVMTNPCVFHCGLAVMGIYRYQLLGRRDEPLDSTRHLVQAIRLLRRDLDAVDAGDAVSKTQKTQKTQTIQGKDTSVMSMIAVVVSLAIRANLADAPAESRTHLLALQRIVALRPGGLAALCTTVSELGNKIRRTDMELALRSGMPTVFGSRYLFRPAPLYCVSSSDKGPSVELPPPLQQVCIELQPAIRDVLVLCSYADADADADTGRQPRLGTVQYQDLVISIVQRLLDYAPLDGARPPHTLDDLCQLGFLSFMTTILYREPSKRAAYSGLLSGLFRSRLGELDSSKQYLELQFWLNFVYAMSHASSDFERCCRVDLPTADRIRALGVALAIRSWEAAVTHLRVYPWVAAFHDDMCQKIWEQAICEL